MDKHSIPYMVSLSDKRRKHVESQKNKNYVMRKTSILEQFMYNVIPIISTSTILAPLNRLKILLQVNKTILFRDVTWSSLLNDIRKDQGLYALWKGNVAGTYRILAQLFSRIVFYDRFKFYFNKKKTKFNEKKIKIPGVSIVLSALSATISAITTTIISYPFDLAHTRLTSDMTVKNNSEVTTISKVISSAQVSTETTNLSNRFGLFNYYKGVSFSLISILPNFVITIIGYEIISKLGVKKMNDSYFSHFFKNFGATSIVSIIASSVTYPIDTLKRLIQVSGTTRYNFDFFSNTHAFFKVKSYGLLNFYNGFSLHLIRNIPFSFIQYNIFLSVCGLNERIKKIGKNEKNNKEISNDQSQTEAV